MIFTELLTGKAEVPDGNEAVFQQSEGPIILPIILRCLATDPADRYPSAQEILDDLEKIRESHYPEKIFSPDE
jgi:serine/threonine protein kinase